MGSTGTATGRSTYDNYTITSEDKNSIKVHTDIGDYEVLKMDSATHPYRIEQEDGTITDFPNRDSVFEFISDEVWSTHTREYIDGLTDSYIRSHFKEVFDRIIPDGIQAHQGVYDIDDTYFADTIAGKLGWGFNEKDLNNLGRAVMNGNEKTYAGATEMLTDANFHTGSRLLDQAHEAVANGTPKKQAYQPYFDYVKQEFANR